ncbi:uncharacterized protein LOC115582622 isoform X2 [Sparus aurata]|uniref:uncharacterized protein LOC115582622 isoform X2 n=1 Tax=Sparus aurata TaxID=8175 RepID=UPI0011C169C1|nr:uncharacterized protein LOC115582622 isoform X2 [Sparus aurata]
MDGGGITSNQEPEEEPQTAGPQQQVSSDCSPPSKQCKRTKHKCPICGQLYADIIQHLRSTEKVVNKTELLLLSKTSHRHFRTNLDCPVHLCKSKHINRLDKHLQKIHHLKNPMVSLYIEKAKDRYIARELALLRASKPVPPMVSHLDEVDASAIEEGVRRVIEARSQAAASATVPPLSGPLRSSPPASQASCDPDRQAPSTSQVCDPETVPAVQDPCQQAKRGRRHSVVSTPDPGCRNCQLLSAELKVVKDLLEIEIERNDELKQLHCSTMRATAAKHRRRAPFDPSKAPRYVSLVEEFRSHTEGANPSRKTSDNAKQRGKHVIDFLKYMAEPGSPSVDLLFLRDHARVRGFVEVLQGKRFTPTTQRSYLMDVVAFLKYISNMAPLAVRLGTKRINCILVELRARLKDIGRDIVSHQLSVRRRKSERLVKAKTHSRFMHEAPKRITAALVELEKHPEDRGSLKEFFGLLAGYIISTTGHRKGVVVNMTTKEVNEAEKTTQGARIIRVGQHKTQRHFGEAAVPLNPSEYSWLQRYNLLRHSIEGGKEASTFFHTTSGGVLLRLSEYFKEAWKRMGLGTPPTFNMLRSSVATYAKRHLGDSAYKKVATFMCHDASTAKRFYHAEDPAEVTLKSRELSMMAISSYAANEEPDPEEDEENVPKRTYQLRERRTSDGTDKQEVEFPFQKREWLSSSEGDGSADEWKPTQKEFEDDSEEEEEQVIQSVHTVAKRKRSVLQREEECSSGQKTTQAESEEDSEEEEEQVTRRVHKMAKRKRSESPVWQREMQPAFVSPGTAKMLTTHSKKVNIGKIIFHKSPLYDVTMPISGDIIKHQAGSTVGQMIPLGSVGETVSKELLLENEISVADTTFDKNLSEGRAGEYKGQEKEGEVDEGSLEKSKTEGEDKNKTENKIKEGRNTEKETQEDSFEKIESKSEKIKKSETKIQEESLEKMESKNENGEKRETKIQEKSLEKMESKSERERREKQGFKRSLWRRWRVRVKRERRENQRFEKLLW